MEAADRRPTIAVVARYVGDHLDAVRYELGGGAVQRALAGARVPWEPGQPLGDPFERHLSWHIDEPVLCFVRTPMLSGHTVELEWSRPAVEEQREHIRAFVQQARWQAREVVRDEAAAFFHCALEDIVIRSDVVGEWRERFMQGSVVLPITVLACGPNLAEESFSKHPWGQGSLLAPWELVPPPDVPQFTVALLPVLLSDLISSEGQIASLLVLEESQLTFIVRRGKDIVRLKSVPIGAVHLLDYLVNLLECSFPSAQALLDRMHAGQLSQTSLQLLQKTLRPFGPLFRAAHQLCVEHASPEVAHAPLTVAGYWPLLLQGMLTRRISRPGSASQPEIQAWARRDTAHAQESSARFSVFSPSVSLLLDSAAKTLCLSLLIERLPSPAGVRERHDTNSAF